MCTTKALQQVPRRFHSLNAHRHIHRKSPHIDRSLFYFIVPFYARDSRDAHSQFGSVAGETERIEDADEETGGPTEKRVGDCKAPTLRKTTEEKAGH